MKIGKISRFAGAVLVVGSLAACGGGGGDAAQPEPAAAGHHASSSPSSAVTVTTVAAGVVTPPAPAAAPAEPAERSTRRKSRPGNPDVYSRISSMTACGDLQKEYDLAEVTAKRPGRSGEDTWREIGRAYKSAAEDRMEAIGCIDS